MGFGCSCIAEFDLLWARASALLAALLALALFPLQLLHVLLLLLFLFASLLLLLFLPLLVQLCLSLSLPPGLPLAEWRFGSRGAAAAAAHFSLHSSR